MGKAACSVIVLCCYRVQQSVRNGKQVWLLIFRQDFAQSGVLLQDFWISRIRMCESCCSDGFCHWIWMQVFRLEMRGRVSSGTGRAFLNHTVLLCLKPSLESVGSARFPIGDSILEGIVQDFFGPCVSRSSSLCQVGLLACHLDIFFLPSLKPRELCESRRQSLFEIRLCVFVRSEKVSSYLACGILLEEGKLCHVTWGKVMYKNSSCSSQ